MKGVRIIFLSVAICSLALALLLVWGRTACEPWVKQTFTTMFILMALVFQKEYLIEKWNDDEE